MEIVDRDSPVDPRIEADAQIARALQIVCDASNVDDMPARDYTDVELETLFFALSMAMIQLAKIPGGKAARDRFYNGATDSLVKRGRQDLVDEVKVNEERRRDARKIIKEVFGENVDFSPGTTGFSLVKMIETADHDRDALRAKVEALASLL